MYILSIHKKQSTEIQSFGGILLFWSHFDQILDTGFYNYNTGSRISGEVLIN